jgi:hypothetical protein
VGLKYFKLSHITSNTNISVENEKIEGVDVIKITSPNSRKKHLLLLSGTDGVPMYDIGFWLAQQGYSVITLDYMAEFTASKGCISKVDIDRMSQILTDRIIPEGEQIDIVGISGGADLALMLGNKLKTKVGVIHAASPTAWHFNGAKGFMCAYPSSPWVLNGKTVPYVLFFKNDLSGIWDGILVKNGQKAQVIPSRKKLQSLSNEMKKHIAIDTSKITAKVNIYGGQLDHLTVAQESITALCKNQPLRKCVLYKNAGHDLIGVPETATLCDSDIGVLKDTPDFLYCLSTSYARDAIMRDIIRSQSL